MVEYRFKQNAYWVANILTKNILTSRNTEQNLIWTSADRNTVGPIMVEYRFEQNTYWVAKNILT